MNQLEMCTEMDNSILHTIISTILQSILKLVKAAKDDPDFIWYNDDNMGSYFHIDGYYNDSGDVRRLNKLTNITVSIIMEDLREEFGFGVIDIFSDRVELYNNVNFNAVSSFEIDDSTEYDEGYIFQLQTEHAIMPFTLEHFEMIKFIASILQPEGYEDAEDTGEDPI